MDASAVKRGMRVRYVGDADNHSESHLIPSRSTVGTIIEVNPNNRASEYSAQVRWDEAPPENPYDTIWWYHADVIAPIIKFGVLIW